MFNSGGGYLGGYSYSPDGEERATGPNARIAENQLRYIGELSLGGGLYKFGARYYDSSQGRFTQMDPSGQERNAYSYGKCNPVNSKDPSGLNASADCWRQATIVFGSIIVITSVFIAPNPANIDGALLAVGALGAEPMSADGYYFVCDA